MSSESGMELILVENLLRSLITLGGSCAAGAWDIVFGCCTLCGLGIFILCTGKPLPLLSDAVFWAGLDVYNDPEFFGLYIRLLSSFWTNSEESWLTSPWHKVFVESPDGEAMESMGCWCIWEALIDRFKFEWGCKRLWQAEGPPVWGALNEQDLCNTLDLAVEPGVWESLFCFFIASRWRVGKRGSCWWRILLGRTMVQYQSSLRLNNVLQGLWLTVWNSSWDGWRSMAMWMAVLMEPVGRVRRC